MFVILGNICLRAERYILGQLCVSVVLVVYQKEVNKGRCFQIVSVQCQCFAFVFMNTLDTWSCALLLRSNI